MKRDISPTQQTSPRKIRRDALRPSTTSFSDLERLVVMSYEAYRKIHKIVTPYINRQNGNDQFNPPSRDLFSANVKMGGDLTESAMLSRMISSTIDFYTSNKGRKQLIEPHPSVLHSVQLQKSDFRLTELTPEEVEKIAPTLNKWLHPEKLRNIIRVDILNHGPIAPLYFDNLRMDKFQYLILRPKMGKTGVPVIKFWEALFFTQSFNYIIDHTDSEINPRYCGII